MVDSDVIQKMQESNVCLQEKMDSMQNRMEQMNSKWNAKMDQTMEQQVRRQDCSKILPIFLPIPHPQIPMGYHIETIWVQWIKFLFGRVSIILMNFKKGGS